MLRALLLLVPLVAPTVPREDPPRPAGPERVVVAGTRVRLAPPAGFVRARDFTGFLLPDSGVSILVNEMRGAPFSELRGLFEQTDALKKKGIRVLATEDARLGGREARLGWVTQTERDIGVHKWIAITGDETCSVQVMATIPDVFLERHRERLKAAVLSAEWDPTIVVDPFADLDWTVECPEGMRYANRMTNVLVFNPEGVPTPKDKQAPVFLVGTSVTGVPIEGELRAAAELRIRQNAALEKLEILRSEAVQVAGVGAWEIRARGEHQRTHAAGFVYQLLIPRPDGYVIAQAFGAASQAAEWLPRVERAARSWRPRPPAPEDAPAPR